MKSNAIATTLKVIGWLIFAGGIILVLSADFDEDFTIGTVLVSSFISCMVFMGLGEIIDLLQKNADTQSEILTYLKNPASKSPIDPTLQTSQQDFNEQTDTADFPVKEKARKKDWIVAGVIAFAVIVLLLVKVFSS